MKKTFVTIGDFEKAARVFYSELDKLDKLDQQHRQTIQNIRLNGKKISHIREVVWPLLRINMSLARL